MKTIITAALAALVLSACGGLPINLGGQDQSESAILGLSAVAIPDLQAASADAVAHNDVVANHCWTGLIPIAQSIQALRAPATQAPAVAQNEGAFSALQRIRNAKTEINSLTQLRRSGQLAQFRQAINLACGALWIDMKVGIVDPLGLFSGVAAP